MCWCLFIRLLYIYIYIYIYIYGYVHANGYIYIYIHYVNTKEENHFLGIILNLLVLSTHLSYSEPLDFFIRLYIYIYIYIRKKKDVNLIQ